MLKDPEMVGVGERRKFQDPIVQISEQRPTLTPTGIMSERLR